MGLLYDAYAKQHGRVLGDMPDMVQKREVRDFLEMKEVVNYLLKMLLLIS